MTLRKQALLFSLGVAGIALALTAIAASSVYLLVSMQDRLDRLSRFRADIMRAEGLATEVLLDGGARPMLQWDKLFLVLQEDLRETGPWLPAKVGQRREFMKRLEAMDLAFLRLAQLPQDVSPNVRSVLLLQLRANKDALLSRLEEIEASTRASVSGRQEWLIAGALAIIVILLVFTVGHYWITRRHLFSAFEEVGQVIHRLSVGHLAEPVVTRRGGEVRQVLESLDGMRAHLHEALERETEQRRRAEQLSRAKSGFVASVSHELRTPLTGLLGRLELASGRASMPEIRHDLAQAKGAGEHLLALVNQVLDFSRIESGRIELAVAPFDPRAMVLALEAMVSAQAAEKGLALRIDFPAGGEEGRAPSCLCGDRSRILQILLNLVGNAIKFTPAGAVTVTGRLREAGPGRAQLEVVVSDTGPGIPQHLQASIFEDFVQLEQSGDPTQAGAGLGLAISAHLIREMSGTIEVDSPEGGGARFCMRVDLPRALPAAVEDVAPAPAMTAGLSVLVVEDVAFNRDIVREFLTTDGHEVAEAADGAEALRLLAAGHRFDAVLMDINMPVMDGLEATRRIRASGAPWADVPILGLTANAFNEQVRAYLDAGMTGCLSKPVVWDELFARLSDVTGRTVARSGMTVRAAPEMVVPAMQPPSSARVGRSGVADGSGTAPAIDGPPIDPQRFQDLVTYLGTGPATASLRDAMAHLEEGIAALPGLAGSPADLVREAHALSRAASNYGFDDLARRLKAIENPATGDRSIEAALAELEHLVSAARAACEALIASLPEGASDPGGPSAGDGHLRAAAS